MFPYNGLRISMSRLPTIILRFGKGVVTGQLEDDKSSSEEEETEMALGATGVNTNSDLCDPSKDAIEPPAKRNKTSNSTCRSQKVKQSKRTEKETTPIYEAELRDTRSNCDNDDDNNDGDKTALSRQKHTYNTAPIRTRYSSEQLDHAKTTEGYPEPPRKRLKKDSHGHHTTEPAVETAPAPDVAPAPGQHQPQPGNTEEKRALRSKDSGGRHKTILDNYFPWLDEQWAEDAKKLEYVAYDTPMVVVEELPIRHTRSVPKRYATEETEDTRKPTTGPVEHIAFDEPEKQTSIRAPKQVAIDVFDFTDFMPITRRYKSDPLKPEIYEKHHRRQENAEKRVRNIERGKVTHEVGKLEEQLELLQGPEWLKAMGYDRIRAMSVEEKKKIEKTKVDLIAEIETIKEKFRIWKEDEKRRKYGKNTGDNAESTSDAPESAHEESEEPEQQNGKTPPATRRGHLGGKTPKHVEAIRKMEEFTSFYAEKPHLRPMAVHPFRKNYRNLTAFGEPLPKLVDQDFSLPDDLVDNQAHWKKKMRSMRRRD